MDIPRCQRSWVSAAHAQRSLGVTTMERGGRGRVVDSEHCKNPIFNALGKQYILNTVKIIFWTHNKFWTFINHHSLHNSRQFQQKLIASPNSCAPPGSSVNILSGPPTNQTLNIYIISYCTRVWENEFFSSIPSCKMNFSKTKFHNIFSPN